MAAVLGFLLQPMHSGQVASTLIQSPCFVTHRLFLTVSLSIVRNTHASEALSSGAIILTGGVGGGTLYNDVWKSTDSGLSWNLITAQASWSRK